MEMVKLHLDRILHGGDYNPEQWPEALWDEDVRLMREARVNVATLPVFGWSALQPDEAEYTFEWLDKVIEKLDSAGVKLCLATPTASMPPWMAHKYPQTQRADRDGHRIRRPKGNRQNICPNSPDFRRLSTDIARKMAQRYGTHPALLLWHVSNEYCVPCYCETCAMEFRAWLRRRYETLDELNDRWYTDFWGSRYTAWEQIDPPYHDGQGALQALKIDYDRFGSDSLLACYLEEKRVLREITPGIPITTNMMGFHKPLDYQKWAKEVDVIAWDSYPSYDHTPADIAMSHALMRGCKEGEPWLLIEQTPSQTNWQRYCFLKRPGILRLWSYQAIAHGSDAVMYFQFRQARGAIEKFHGAIVSHEGSARPRVFQEVAQLGRELEKLGDRTIGGRVQADAAILYDWENRWAIEHSAGPSADLTYIPQVASFFNALHGDTITADLVPPLTDLSRYKLVVAPMLHMVKPGVAEKLEAFVRGGGTLVISYFSGIVDETDRVYLGGYPGPLRKLAGVWVEEIDPLPPDRTNRVIFKQRFGELSDASPCNLICERMHVEGAEVIATYGDDFYAGEPAITCNRFGRGSVYYIGTSLEPSPLRLLMREVARRAGAAQVLPRCVDGVEATVRVSPDGGKSLLYVLNHNAFDVQVRLPEGRYHDLLTGDTCHGETKLPPRGVRILSASTAS
jgi:beta-galactosidase